jgi:hypothetical protein
VLELSNLLAHIWIFFREVSDSSQIDWFDDLQLSAIDVRARPLART